MMTAADVVRVLDALAKAGITAWLDGGWGVDALVGEETREHEDLDMVVSVEHLDRALTSLAPLGYELVEDLRPTRLVLAANDSRRIDFHPVVFDRDGSARQIGAGPNGGDAVYPAAGFAGLGSIAGRSDCLTPKLLVLHHLGYPPAAKDRHNVRLLCERFDIPLPDAYR